MSDQDKDSKNGASKSNSNSYTGSHKGMPAIDYASYAKVSEEEAQIEEELRRKQ